MTATNDAKLKTEKSIVGRRTLMPLVSTSRWRLTSTRCWQNKGRNYDKSNGSLGACLRIQKNNFSSAVVKAVDVLSGVDIHKGKKDPAKVRELKKGNCLR